MCSAFSGRAGLTVQGKTPALADKTHTRPAPPPGGRSATARPQPEGCRASAPLGAPFSCALLRRTPLPPRSFANPIRHNAKTKTPRRRGVFARLMPILVDCSIVTVRNNYSFKI